MKVLRMSLASMCLVFAGGSGQGQSGELGLPGAAIRSPIGVNSETVRGAEYVPVPGQARHCDEVLTADDFRRLIRRQCAFRFDATRPFHAGSMFVRAENVDGGKGGHLIDAFERPLRDVDAYGRGSDKTGRIAGVSEADGNLDRFAVFDVTEMPIPEADIGAGLRFSVGFGQVEAVARGLRCGACLFQGLQAGPNGYRQQNYCEDRGYVWNTQRILALSFILFLSIPTIGWALWSLIGYEMRCRKR